MKNVAIFGSSRSGKSTLAGMIVKEFSNYFIISGDDIRWTFQKVLPGNNINNRGGKGMKEDFPKFLSTLFYASIDWNDNGTHYIIDSCDITPKKAKELFEKDDTILLFIGTPKQTVEQYFENIRKYQIENDWTYRKSDEHVLKHAERWIKISKKYEDECRELNIWYVDTSFNRDEVLLATFNRIKEMIKE